MIDLSKIENALHLDELEKIRVDRPSHGCSGLNPVLSCVP
jgi:hypothetical protein